jgi:hypothetical protein
MATGLALTAGASRAEPAHIFRLPPEAVDTALVRFGVQAGVSIGGFPVAGCAGRSHGRDRGVHVLAGAAAAAAGGCGFERVDARAYRIVAQRTALAPPDHHRPLHRPRPSSPN